MPRDVIAVHSAFQVADTNNCPSYSYPKTSLKPGSAVEIEFTPSLKSQLVKHDALVVSIRTYVETPEHRTYAGTNATEHCLPVVPNGVPHRWIRLLWSNVLDMARSRCVLVHGSTLPCCNVERRSNALGLCCERLRFGRTLWCPSFVYYTDSHVIQCTGYR